MPESRLYDHGLRRYQASIDEGELGRCHDCNEVRPLREYEKDAPSPRGEWLEAYHIEICQECYEERT